MGFSIIKVVPKRCNPPPPCLPHTFVRRQKIWHTNSLDIEKQKSSLLSLFPHCVFLPLHWSHNAATVQTNISLFSCHSRVFKHALPCSFTPVCFQVTSHEDC